MGNPIDPALKELLTTFVERHSNKGGKAQTPHDEKAFVKWLKDYGEKKHGHIEEKTKRVTQILEEDKSNRLYIDARDAQETELREETKRKQGHGGNGHPNGTSGGTGSDKKEDKNIFEKNKGLGMGLLGGLAIGALLMSVMGPIGLVIGALIGAALGASKDGSDGLLGGIFGGGKDQHPKPPANQQIAKGNGKGNDKGPKPLDAKSKGDARTIAASTKLSAGFDQGARFNDGQSVSPAAVGAMPGQDNGVAPPG